MDASSHDPLDRLLKEAYPAMEVSPDFTLRLWRKLTGRPPASLWKVPVPALGLAAALGVAAGLWTSFVPSAADASLQWDLFGNAPHESMAGSVLDLMKGEPA